MSRPRGGYVGFNRVPAASAINSAASGVWTLREAEALNRAGTWPIALLPIPTISGIQLHLDAADSTTLFNATSGGSLPSGGGSTLRWEDKSGNARHVSEATNPPTRQTAVRNGLDVIRFDGTNELLRTTGNFPLTGNAAFSVFVVYRKTNNTKGNVFGWGSSDTALGACGYYDNGTVSAVAFAGGYGFFTSTPANNTWIQLSILKSPGAINTTTTARLNGVSVAGSGHSTTTPNIVSERFTVGRWANYDLGGSLGATFQGDIGEIIVYNSALSDADRGLVESYLRAKWGIT